MNNYQLYMVGQSNDRGVDSAPPAGIPTSDVDFWVQNIATTGNVNDFIATALSPLQVTVTPTPSHGAELQLGLDLIAAGLASRLTITKFSVGGAALTSLMPGTNNFATLRAILTASRRPVPFGSLQGALVMNQGETEGSAAGTTGASAWAANFTTYHAALEMRVGIRLAKIIVRTRDVLTGGNPAALTILRAGQMSVADYWIDRDDTTTEADGVHDTPAAQNIIGGRIAQVCINNLGWS